MEDARALKCLLKTLTEEEAEQVRNVEIVIEVDFFMRSVGNLPDGKTIYVIGNDKRLKIAERKIATDSMALSKDIRLVDEDNAQEAFSHILNPQAKPNEEVVEEAPKMPELPSITKKVEQQEVKQEEIEDNQEVEEDTNQHQFESRQNLTQCKYGVPILTVERITPNVVGLKESLVVDVTQEEIDRFVQHFKGKVLRSLL